MFVFLTILADFHERFSPIFYVYVINLQCAMAYIIFFTNNASGYKESHSNRSYLNNLLSDAKYVLFGR